MLETTYDIKSLFVSDIFYNGQQYIPTGVNFKLDLPSHIRVYYLSR